MRVLSSRLAAVAERVLPGRPAADIGTDHAALACALVQGQRCPSVVAVDVAQGPIKRAEAAVRGAGLVERVSVRLGDGLGPMHAGEVSTIVICGMGGETIVGILTDGEAKLAGVQRLVLSPHTHVAMVRRHLDQAGWTDVDSCLVRERGHWYTVTAWERGASRFTDADYRWGRLLRQRCDSNLAQQLMDERKRLEAAHRAAQDGRGVADPGVIALKAELDSIDRELSRLA